MKRIRRSDAWLVAMIASGTVVATACGGGDDSSAPASSLDSGIASDATTTLPTSDATTPPSPQEDSSVPPDGAVTVKSVLPGAGIGSAIALSSDDARVVVVNRDAGSVTVFSVTYSDTAPPVLTSVAELKVCAEPWQVALHPNDDDAFVVCRKDQQLVKITGVKTTPVIGGMAAVGSEPTGLSLTPLGTTAWVTNFVDGTVTAVDTTAMTVNSTLDLNATLASAGYLGTGLTSRPGFAHPRSVSISNNLDMNESDESMYITDFFAQTKAPLAADGSNADTAKVGVLYKVSLMTNAVSIIELPPITDIGFPDHKNSVAGCFPNQILSFTVNGAFGYATSVCASPKGQNGTFTPAFPACTTDANCPGAVVGSCGTSKTCATNCAVDTDCGAVGGKCNSNVCAVNTNDVKSEAHPAVTIVDLGGNKAIATVSLTKAYSDFYDQQATPDTSARHFPLLANDVSFVPNSVDAYFSSAGSDGVYHVLFDSSYAAGATIDSVGDPTTPFIDLAPPTADAAHTGHVPIGVVVTHGPHPATGSQSYAFSANDGTRNVSVLDLKKNEVAGLSANTPSVAASSPLPTDSASLDVVQGKILFQTGLNRWSHNGQAWGACAQCHIDGLSDNVTWFFTRGPRQSISLDGSYSKTTTDQRIFGWSANFDEASDLDDGVLRQQFDGVGAIVSDPALNVASRIDFVGAGHGLLNGSSTAAADPTNPANLAKPSVLRDWAQLTAYLKTIRSPRRPTTLDTTKVTAGKALFQQGNCQGCHGGPLWTESALFYAPDPTKALNAALKTKSWSSAVTTAGFPTALLPVATPAMQTMRYDGTNASATDSLWCAIRPVGTYGLAETAVGFAELRKDMATAAQGNGLPADGAGNGVGFNVPSLLGLSLGAPYFHAGGARTLEAALSDSFKSHHASLTAGFLASTDTMRDEEVAALAEYLLSLDTTEPTVALPALGATGGSFCSSQ